MDGDACAADDFLYEGEATTGAARVGLSVMLQHIADLGPQEVPPGWSHEANKRHGIYEFIKGPLRLFYFKGQGNTIAICTGGGRKKGKKADKALVAAAIREKQRYMQALNDNTYEEIEDDDE
jgi:hypothetical protein